MISDHLQIAAGAIHRDLHERKLEPIYLGPLRNEAERIRDTLSRLADRLARFEEQAIEAQIKTRRTSPGTRISPCGERLNQKRPELPPS